MTQELQTPFTPPEGENPQNGMGGPAFHEDEDSPEAFAERIRKLFNIEKTSIEELVEIAEREPGSERLEVFLDDLTYEALTENEEFARNSAAMQSKKLSAEAQEELRDKQRSLFDSYRQAIIHEAGLPSEIAMTEVEKSKNNIQAILKEQFSTQVGSEPVKVLEALGIISHDDEGKEIFTYPYGLFPGSTDNKWETYLETVKNHLRVQRAVKHKLLDPSELGVADSTRVMAHNAVARDVDGILGLDKLPDAQWDFKKTREMLAKMRDTRFPSVETAEKALTEEAVAEGIIGLHALKALRSTRLSDMHKE